MGKGLNFDRLWGIKLSIWRPRDKIYPIKRNEIFKRNRPFNSWQSQFCQAFYSHKCLTRHKM